MKIAYVSRETRWVDIFQEQEAVDVVDVADVAAAKNQKKANAANALIVKKLKKVNAADVVAEDHINAKSLSIIN